jgi:hypothetical protein
LLPLRPVMEDLWRSLRDYQRKVERKLGIEQEE